MASAPPWPPPGTPTTCFGKTTRSTSGAPARVGDRAGNFAVQNADLLLSVGCRLNIRQIGYEFAAFARDAWKVVVDIDALELRKPTVSPDLAVHSDARFFLDELDARAARALALRRRRRRAGTTGWPGAGAPGALPGGPAASTATPRPR